MTSSSPQIEIVIPVFNEQGILRESVQTLDSFLEARLPELDVLIRIVDNASTDETPLIAGELARDLARVRFIRLPEKGRGRALRSAWTGSDADILAYMDVDLSTDLRALPELLEPLLAAHADVAIGSRLSPGAEVSRGAKREVLSRGYNVLLRTLLDLRISDAQCGFKAARASAIQPLLARIEDDGWFFDTELLYLARRERLAIRELPVRWVDDPDSRVRIMSTVWEDLKGIARLRAGGRAQRVGGRARRAGRIAQEERDAPSAGPRSPSAPASTPMRESVSSAI